MIAIIGAGPAGLAAADILVKAGREITIIDQNHHVGGQYWRHKYGAAFPEGKFTYLINHPKITWLLGTTVWQIHKNKGSFTIEISREGKSESHLCEVLLVATGAYERVIPTKGWTTPGCTTAGGLQSLAKGHGVVPGKKVVIAGRGVFALPVAQSIAEYPGVEIAAIIEARSFLRWWRNIPGLILNPTKIIESLGYLRFIALKKIPLKQRKVITEIKSCENGTNSVVIRNSSGRGAESEIECDLVATTFGFTPDMTIPSILGLARRYKFEDVVVKVDSKQRTSIAGVFAAGEVTGIGGHELAMTEGALAGLAITNSGGVKSLVLKWRRLREQIFADGLYRIYRIPKDWVEATPRDVIVCRCEEVSLGEIVDSIEELGADSARVAKLFTRAGMGLCQGRICQRNVADIATVCGKGSTIDPNRETMRPIGGVVTLGELSD